MKDYHCFSGGALGADSYFDLCCQKNDVHITHFYHGKKTPLGNHLITTEELDEGWQQCLRANNEILHRNGVEKYKNLLARNWFQVKSSETVFAVSRIEAGMVMGGTAWAVAMAVLNNKPTYVFDMNQNIWLLFSSEPNHRGSKDFTFVGANPPKLTSTFAGIGSRDLTDEGKNAIENLFIRSLL